MSKFKIIILIFLTAFPISIIPQTFNNQKGTKSIKQFVSNDNIITIDKETSSNLLVNGNFSNGDKHWSTWIHPEASAYGSVQNKEFAMSIDDGGNKTYHIQLIQNDLLIEKGKNYIISFDAYADEPRKISISVQQSSEPWTIYHAFFNLYVTTTKQTYHTSFSMSNPTDSISRLVIDMGLSKSDVYLDNINLSLNQAPQTPFNRGINLADWFENFPNISHIHFKRYNRKTFENIKLLGFDHVRLPIELFDMTGPAPDYTIDPLLFPFLDQAIDWVEDLGGLYIILGNHSFDIDFEMSLDFRDQLLAVWAQMAKRYNTRSDLICYEVLNEPHGISDTLWNKIQKQTIDTIRSIDKKHTIIVGPANWNSYYNLNLMPVFEDTNLIYTFHFYDPGLFSHQGAYWLEPSLTNLSDIPYPYEEARMPELPAEYYGTWVELAYNNYPYEGFDAWIQSRIDIAIHFMDERQVPLWCGEFGVYQTNCQLEDRTCWLSTVRNYLEVNNISWAMWEYADGFGIFENSRELFEYDVNIPIIEALGLTPPPQNEFELFPDTTGFIIYDDFIPQRVFHHDWNPNGTLNYCLTDYPKYGDFCISWTGADLYSFIGFRLSPIHDLMKLQENNYVLDLWVRSSHSSTKFDVRFLDTDTDDPDDHPWRIRYTVDSTMADWDGTWQHIQIPLNDFTEQGAWEDGSWYIPQGDFDWSQIEHFEIAAEHHDLNDIELFFDEIRIAELSETEPLSVYIGDPVRLPSQLVEKNYK